MRRRSCPARPSWSTSPAPVCSMFDDEFAAALYRVRASESDEDVTFNGYSAWPCATSHSPVSAMLALTTLDDSYVTYQVDDRRIRSLS